MRARPLRHRLRFGRELCLRRIDWKRTEASPRMLCLSRLQELPTCFGGVSLFVQLWQLRWTGGLIYKVLDSSSRVQNTSCYFSFYGCIKQLQESQQMNNVSDHSISKSFWDDAPDSTSPRATEGLNHSGSREPRIPAYLYL